MIDKQITILITSSPSLRHPSTEMIRKTIKLCREQLPKSKILILQDGIRPEQEYLRERYEKYLERLNKWAYKQENIDTVIFTEFSHQAGMVKKAIQWVTTPTVLFIEHDFPVVGDIPWEDIVTIINKGWVHLVRFYLEPRLEPAHKHLFLDEKPVLIGNVPVIRTGQWSQRPHIASTDFYSRIMKRHFNGENSKTYIEDAIHGIFGAPFTVDPFLSWKKNKLCIYYPEGKLTRCKHLDGRLGEDKYSLL